MNRDKSLPLTETVYYILLALRQPAHGYLIMQKVEELSAGNVRLAAGTLYGAIENLLKLKYIELISTTNTRRKVYQLTKAGETILYLDYQRMEHMLMITKQSFKKAGEYDAKD